MAAKTVDKLIRELDCAICTKTLKNPKSLSCGHSFCEECLKQYDNTSEVRSGDIKCHMCREITILSREGVAGLKSNPLICRVLEVLEAKKNSAQIMCDACGDSESPLTTYCRDCLHFICDSCASSHAKMKLLMKDHRTVLLDKIENGTIKIKWMEEGSSRKAHECEEHIGELRRFYCRTCKKHICMDCIVLEHPKPYHDCTTVQKIFQETQEKVKDRLKGCKEKKERVNTILNDVDVRKTEANQKFHMMKERIRDLKSTAVANLNKAEEELLQEVEVLEEKLNGKVQAFSVNMITTIENLTKAESKAKEFVSAKEVTDIAKGPFLPEYVLKEVEELIASDVTMTISMDLMALKATMIQESKLPEVKASFAKLLLPHVWRETQMFPIPNKDILNIFSDGNSIYVACKKGIYIKLLPHDADPSDWMKLYHCACINEVVDMAISLTDQTFSFIAENNAACTQLFRLELNDFPTYHGNGVPSSFSSTVPPCPLNPGSRITVDSQSRIVVADNTPTKPARMPKISRRGRHSLGHRLPQQTMCSSVCIFQTASAGTMQFGHGNIDNKPSSAASIGKEGTPELGLPIPKTFTTIYRGNPRKMSSAGMQSSGVLGLGISQFSSDSQFEIPFNRVRSLAATKSGQLVFLRCDKEAIIITDKDGKIQHEIKEPGRMYLSISCTESDALYVLSALWGSHIVTLAKHSLEDGGLLEYIIDELDVSANFQLDEWPVIGNHGNDLVVINIGDEICVYSAVDWD